MVLKHGVPVRRINRMRIVLLVLATAAPVMALPPRDALPLEEAAELNEYRLRVRFSSDEGGSVRLKNGRVIDLAGSEVHDVALETAPKGARLLRAWSGGRLVIGPEEIAGGEGVPVVLPAPGVTVEESWLQALERSDHAPILKSWNDATLEQGQRIYSTLCVVCHGTKDEPGSLPTAPSFASGPFKNGADPHSMFHTLAHGFGQMTPQPQFTTAEKYAVIHYIRETYLRPHLPDQLTAITPEYLDALPIGRALAEVEVEDKSLPPYRKMDFGPVLFWTYQVENGNIARKGIAIRLDEGPGGVSNGRAWMIYDHDTMRVAAASTGEFIDWRGIAFDGSHGTHTSLKGDLHFVNPVGPGWASPTGGWEDVRPLGTDELPYGPLPRDWLRYEGIHLHGSKVVISAQIGGTRVLESPGWIDYGSTPVFVRTLNVGPARQALRVRVAPGSSTVKLLGDGALDFEDGFWVATLHGGAKCRLLVSRVDAASVDALAKSMEPLPDLTSMTHGGPPRWPEELTTTSEVGAETPGFAADTYPLPVENPWNAWMRPGGFDFTPDGKAAVLATWNGDVWRVDGIMEPAPAKLRWRRISSGLFQPLGVRYRGDDLFIACRDQIARLRDLNGDGEMDSIECFNNDHQVTEHFHEFAMGLQTDADGNFYYAKGARHARPAVVPHHGTLLRVSADGTRTEILATGFRAPNGVLVDEEEGVFFLTDQEGNWVPKNRINRVKPGEFHGNMWGHHSVTDPADSAMTQPVVWITNDKDRSPAELVRVPKNAWGPLGGSLLNLSYGTGRVFVVPIEESDGIWQGAVCELPIEPFATGIMRGRFAPDGSLFACGMFAWAGNATAPGGFHRIRHLGGPVHLPLAVHPTRDGLAVTFTDPLDRASIEPSAFEFHCWSLKRLERYGSPHLNERELEITGARLDADARTVVLEIPDIDATHGYELKARFRAADGTPVSRSLHGTIHHLPNP